MKTKLQIKPNPPVDTRMDWKYCEGILPKISRTFALNIVQLRGDVYKAVLLGYLFFRIADTFEDNTIQNEAEKIRALDDYAEIFRGNKSLDERLSTYESLKSRWQEESADKNLIENGDRAIRCYFELPDIYREIIDPHIARTSEGMARFQRRKLEVDSKVFQLQTVEDLEEYCYQVAGIVGEMLTQIFCQQKGIESVKSELGKYQTQFGLALQITNIVKDYQKDLDRGWCYIPASVTEKCGIKINDLRHLSVLQRKRVLGEFTLMIVNYFDSTLRYISTVPEKERHVRIFCIMPFVLAYNTLLHVAQMQGNKLSRDQVAAILVECKDYARSNNLLRSNYSSCRARLLSEVQNGQVSQ